MQKNIGTEMQHGHQSEPSTKALTENSETNYNIKSFPEDSKTQTATAKSGHQVELSTKVTTLKLKPVNPLAWEDPFLKGVYKIKPTSRATTAGTDDEQEDINYGDDYEDNSASDKHINDKEKRCSTNCKKSKDKTNVVSTYCNHKNNNLIKICTEIRV